MEVVSHPTLFGLTELIQMAVAAPAVVLGWPLVVIFGAIGF